MEVYPAVASDDEACNRCSIRGSKVRAGRNHQFPTAQPSRSVSLFTAVVAQWMYVEGRGPRI